MSYPTKPVFYVNPPKKCDSCKTEIDTVFYDAYIPTFQTWGNICPDCAEAYKVRTGVGLGQKYVRCESGRYLKTEG